MRLRYSVPEKDLIAFDAEATSQLGWKDRFFLKLGRMIGDMLDPSRETHPEALPLLAGAAVLLAPIVFIPTMAIGAPYVLMLAAGTLYARSAVKEADTMHEENFLAILRQNVKPQVIEDTPAPVAALAMKPAFDTASPVAKAALKAPANISKNAPQVAL